MRRSTLWVCALLTIATFGCDRIKQAIDKRRGKTKPAPAQPAQARPAQDTARRPPPPPPPPTVVAQVPRPLRDEPYVSDDTGTIAPGMSERDVYTLWGAPVAVRRVGEYTYLFFPNGCEYSCGTMDLVTLQNGQVVDAVVRWPGHGYSGQSSSPGDRIPGPTGAGDTLTVQEPPPSMR